MGLTPLLILAAAVNGPQIEVATLGGAPQIVAAQQRPNGTTSFALLGEQQRGSLLGITRTSVMLQTADEEIRLPLNEVVQLRWPHEIAAPAANSSQVVLTDGSVIRCTELTVGARDAELKGTAFGDITVDRQAIARVQFRESAALAGEWSELAGRNSRQDFLVVEKDKRVTEGEDVRIVKTLDHLQGVVTAITADEVQFRLDGNDVPVKRTNLFGVIYAAREPVDSEYNCLVESVRGDRLRASRVTCDATEMFVSTATGERLVIPLDQLARVDFSRERVQYLSDLEPRDVKYTPYFDLVHKLRRDSNQIGQPLRLQGRSFDRGLYLHSRTQLSYRLEGDYRRFQAVMGIDQLVEPNGDVHVVIKGDGQILLEADVRGDQPPRVLDLDVTDVLELEILVDFGQDLDISDHLDLADAKLLR